MKKLLIIFFIALLLRVSYTVIFVNVKPPVQDGIEYDTIAWNVANGSGFSINPNVPTPKRAPGYPFFLSFIYFIFGHNYLIARLLQAILSASTCIILFYAAKNLFDQRIAFFSAWLLALYPAVIVYSGLILSETLFTFLLGISILMLIRGMSGSKTGYFIGSGIFLGFATLTRPATILLPIVVLLFILLSNRKLLANWTVFVLFFLLTIFPWIYRNHTLFRYNNICTTSIERGLFATGNMASGLSETESYKRGSDIADTFPENKIFIPKQSPSVELNKKLTAEGFALIKQNPKSYFLIVLKRLPSFWLTSHSGLFGIDKQLSEYLKEGNYLFIGIRLFLLLLQGVFLLLALIGILSSLEHWKNYGVLVFIFIYFTGHITFDLIPRFQVPVMPFVFIFVSVGFTYILKAIKARAAGQLKKIG